MISRPIGITDESEKVQYFDWIWWQFAYAASPHWDKIVFADEKKVIWNRFLFGLYFKQESSDD